MIGKKDGGRGDMDGPDGEGKRVEAAACRYGLIRWIRSWRQGGFEGLMPFPRRVSNRTPAEMLTLAARLQAGDPFLGASQIAVMLHVRYGWAPSVRTLQRHLAADRQLCA